MFQSHPLNANGKLLRRFYEPLVLLGVLDPTRGAERPDLITDRGLEEQAKLWRNFLDQASWICDSDKGGDTVTSVAAQKVVEDPIFWLASNSKSRNKARDHLAWVLDRLNSLYAASPPPIPQLEGEVTALCIQFSSRRIKTYTTWLLKAIGEAKRAVQQSMSPEGKYTGLFKDLNELEKLATNPEQLCAFASRLRNHECMKLLSKRHAAHPSRSVWSDIRHYIGRLGSWTKAAKILVLGAQRFPHRIENARVKVIEPRGCADLPNNAHLTDLTGVLRRMLPADQSSLVEELSQVLSDVNTVALIDARFREDYANIQPRPHAELLVLEHFYHNGFSFVSDDKYIGCSKPSCYCCHLYMQCHPGGFTPRPCHGNLWINWAPPIPLPVLSPRTKTRPQDHHTYKLLQEMVVRIRQDLQDQILSRRPRRQKLPDSTTGMSSVVFESDTLRAALESIPEHLRGADSDVAEDGVSQLPLEIQGDETDCDSSAGSIDAEQKVSGECRDTDVEEGHGIALTATRCSGKECIGRLQESDDDEEEDGGVLLFKGRNTRLF